MTAQPQPDTVVVFAYGTIRPGEYNYWMKPAVRHVTRGCTTKGRLYGLYAPYPVANFDEDGTIVGDLLVMDKNEIGFGDKTYYDSMVGMELGAGYEQRVVEVTTPQGDVVLAEAFHYPRRARDQIVSGDWKKRHEEYKDEDFDDEDE